MLLFATDFVKLRFKLGIPATVQVKAIGLGTILFNGIVIINSITLGVIGWFWLFYVACVSVLCFFIMLISSKSLSLVFLIF